MTETEDRRQSTERRRADIYQQASATYEVRMWKTIGAVLGGMLSGLTILVILYGAAKSFSTSAAREEIAPVKAELQDQLKPIRDLSRDNALSIAHMKEDIGEIKSGINRQTEILEKLLKQEQ